MVSPPNPPILREGYFEIRVRLSCYERIAQKRQLNRWPGLMLLGTDPGVTKLLSWQIGFHY
jgi:hypothetical protein